MAQPRVGPEEVLADVGAAGDRVLLPLAVERVVHLLDEHAVDVAREQLVPLAAPDDLDDVPAGAAEQALELLDDLAVAADGAVEALQVAVDDERQVVESLARGERRARPIASGSSISPSPRNAQTREPDVSTRPRFWRYRLNRAW